MVRWYNPWLLLLARVRTVTTTAIGRVVDFRQLHAATDPVGDHNNFGVYDYSAQVAEDEVWIDYVADLGDGWEPTFAVALALAAHAFG